jgi:hypothetical protein
MGSLKTVLTAGPIYALSLSGVLAFQTRPGTVRGGN